jgi:hypothetical protein
MFVVLSCQALKGANILKLLNGVFIQHAWQWEKKQLENHH